MRTAFPSVAVVLLVASASPAHAEPYVAADASDAALRPPSSLEHQHHAVATPRRRDRPNPNATTERWGGGVRLTGLSGIGALPGVNFGAEVAATLRRDELFVEVGLGRWKPERTYLVPETDVELKLDVWALRAGWTSMQMPLRAWFLVEVGELAGARGMHGVINRMVMGDTPQQRQWRAAGGGVGVAWPMSDQARLIGNFELAIPIARERLMLHRGGAYEADPLVARYSVGLEVGWR